MIGAVLVLLGLAIVWLLGDRKIRAKELDDLRYEHKRALHELARRDPLHPMCRCHVLPVEPLQNLKLAAYGLPHRVAGPSCYEVERRDLTAAHFVIMANVKLDFDIIEDPSRPNVLLLSEKGS